MVKMKTKHPVEGPCGSEFPVICNHCGVMTASKSQDLEILKQFLRFFWKTTPIGILFKILFRKFTWRHRLTLLCSNIVKICRREIG